MIFRTTFDFDKPLSVIDHTTKITCLGSCFAQHIGTKLADNKMDILCNPTGTIYNPISICDTIDKSLALETVSENDFFEQQGRWVNYDFHSELSNSNLSNTCQNINDKIKQLHHQISTSDTLIISLGTAFVFNLISGNNIVNNCHKMPSKLFTRQLLTVEEIISHMQGTFEKLFNSNPTIKIILTISPIRHLRDGVVQNNRSKSTLNVAMHQLIDQYDQLTYFPSYEILMDDLRDYRFYNQDMIHPSHQAIDYIWDMFSNKHLSPETIDINKDIASLQNAMHHRPFNSSSPQHQQFRSKMKQFAERLQTKFPALDFKKEIIFFSND